MTFIEVFGRVNEQGKIEFDPPQNLPTGDVRITFEPIDAAALAADEALWDEQFAKSENVLLKLSKKAHDEYVAGLLEAEYDPENDPDAV